MSFFTITAILGVTMAIIVFHYYSPGRKNDVEQAKYDMLNDDDDLVNNHSVQDSQAGQHSQDSQKNNAQTNDAGQHSNENQNENSQEHNQEHKQDNGQDNSHEQNK